MKHDSSDLRVKRTLKCIRDAFFELVMEKDFSQISITELTQRADINRKTLYLHYSSLEDLVEEIEQEFVDELLASLANNASHLDVAGCISVFYHYMNEGSPIQRKLLCDPDYFFFYTKVSQDILDSDFFQKFYVITEHPSIVRAFCVGITSMFRTWYMEGRKIPLDELIDYAGKLMVTGYNGIEKSK